MTSTTGAAPADAMREAMIAARDGLLREAIHMEQDFPGDVPEDCGWWCRLCNDHVDGDRKTGPSSEGHKSSCPIAKLTAALATPPVADPSIPAGMVPWHGGDSAPEDWDGGPVLLRHGGLENAPAGWLHAKKDVEWRRRFDIIAYTPRPHPVADTVGEVGRLREAVTLVDEVGRTDPDRLRLIAKDHERLAPNAYHSADELRRIADRLMPLYVTDEGDAHARDPLTSSIAGEPR